MRLMELVSFLDWFSTQRNKQNRKRLLKPKQNEVVYIALITFRWSINFIWVVSSFAIQGLSECSSRINLVSEL